MAEQTLTPMQLSRSKGIARYQLNILGRITLWLLAILLGSQLLAILISIGTSLFAANTSPFIASGAYADFSYAITFALVCSIVTAGRSTRFLLRFGTPRFSVWLGNLVALICMSIGVLLGSLVISTLVSYGALALKGVLPDAFRVNPYVGTQVYILSDGQAIAASLQDAIKELPYQILWLAEWTSIFYLLACCLRRNRVLTLVILIGVPLALMVLMVIPTMRQALDTARNATEGEMTVLLLRVMQWVGKAMDFITTHWKWVQLGLGVASLPLSYLCMRGTKQP